MKRMSYPGSFIINTFTAFLLMSLNVLFIKVNFNYINSLSGWNFYQVLSVVGSYMIIDGIIWTFFGMLNAINSHIRQGTMDGILMKPIDEQFFVSVWRGDQEDIARIVTGLSLVFFSIKNLIDISFEHFLIYILLLLNGVIIFYSFAILIRSFTFWIIDGSGLWLFVEKVSVNTQYPTDIYYEKLVRGLFTFIIPLAFIATVPARILTNVTIDWKWVGLSFLMCFVFFFGSRAFWKYALQHYSSASS